MASWQIFFLFLFSAIFISGCVQTINSPFSVIHFPQLNTGSPGTACGNSTVLLVYSGSPNFAPSAVVNDNPIIIGINASNSTAWNTTSGENMIACLADGTILPWWHVYGVGTGNMSIIIRGKNFSSGMPNITLAVVSDKMFNGTNVSGLFNSSVITDAFFMDSNSSNLRNYANSSNNGTWHGSCNLQQGSRGASVKFDGSTCYADLGNFPTRGTASMAMQLDQATNTGSAQHFFIARNGGSDAHSSWGFTWEDGLGSKYVIERAGGMDLLYGPNLTNNSMIVLSWVTATTRANISVNFSMVTNTTTGSADWALNPGNNTSIGRNGQFSGEYANEALGPFFFSPNNSIWNNSFNQSFNSTMTFTQTQAYTSGGGGPASVNSSGVETSDNGYTVETFTSNGTLNVSGGWFFCDALVVAGGGGGRSGAGGAGGLNFTTGLNCTGNMVITVGTGGAGKTVDLSTNAGGDNGTYSYFLGVNSTGGGGGSNTVNGQSGAAYVGGSGGGAGSSSVANHLGGAFTGGTGGMGSIGGNVSTSTGTPYPAAGGGGCSQIGENALNTPKGGDGGAGCSYNISNWSAANLTFAAGGGANCYGGCATNGIGGSNIGGNGSTGSGGGDGINATGSGGGGGRNGENGGRGGDGIVIIRFASNATGNAPDINCTFQTNINAIIFQPHFTWNASSGRFSNISNNVYPVNQSAGSGVYRCTNNGSIVGTMQIALNGTYPNVLTVASIDNFTTNIVANQTPQDMQTLAAGASTNVSFYRNYSTTVFKYVNESITIRP